ncbi:unnamed protein product [Mytilus edulis]|uniref:AIG1-type G domain-containing protein n=1 Tax=Mytilus edulis TaxID=6550 RepID=A0A8S3QIE5_MYTED|nr:unnamed protein product [Mytilus edulis]
MVTVSDDNTDDESTNASTQTISCIDIQRYRSLEKAIRVTAYVLRFIQNLRNSKDKRSIGFISVEERCKALKVLIVTVQQETFKDEIESLNSSSQKKVPLNNFTWENWSGKSETGNTLLGKEYFVAKDYGTTVTRNCCLGEVIRGKKKIVVVDTPGLYDTEISKEESKRNSKMYRFDFTRTSLFLVVIQLIQDTVTRNGGRFYSNEMYEESEKNDTCQNVTNRKRKEES